MTNDTMNAEDFANAEAAQTLGPHYFSARRFADALVSKFEVEEFKPMIDNFGKEFAGRLWDLVKVSLISDTESNVQSHIWNTVDQIVRGILSGEKWVINRYVLAERYDRDKVREAVAKHIPRELQDARIADLEKELAAAKKSIDLYTRNRDV